MTLIKFCGMTRDEDVAKAVELGVDAVGFILWPGSPRYVAVDRLAALIAKLPARVIPVGVFVRPTSDAIDRSIEAGIRVAQLHDVVAGSHERPDCDVWTAASLAADGITPDVASGRTVLLDTHDPQRHGGTGRTIDWTRASAIAARWRVMLAGGLTATNVAEAIRAVHPYGVDVASGIEDRPGVKNAHAMQAFVAAVREAYQ